MKLLDTAASNQYSSSHRSNEKGLALFAAKNYIAAVAKFTRAINLNPLEPCYLWHRAEAYLRLADFDSCLLNFRLLKVLLSKQQAYSSYLFQYRMALVSFTWGQCLVDQHRFLDAAVQLDVAAKLDYDPIQIALPLAIAHIGLNDLDAAIRQLYRLIENKVNNIDIYILRAKLYHLQNNIFFANLDLQDAMKIDPTHPEVKHLQFLVLQYAVDFKNKASEQILKKKYQIAVWYLNQAIELDPEDWTLMLLRYCKNNSSGILLAEIGNLDGGLADLKKGCPTTKPSVQSSL